MINFNKTKCQYFNITVSLFQYYLIISKFFTQDIACVIYICVCVYIVCEVHEYVCIAYTIHVCVLCDICVHSVCVMHVYYMYLYIFCNYYVYIMCIMHVYVYCAYNECKYMCYVWHIYVCPVYDARICMLCVTFGYVCCMWCVYMYIYSACIILRIYILLQPSLCWGKVI